MKLKIRKIGNSFGVIIPRQFITDDVLNSEEIELMMPGEIPPPPPAEKTFEEKVIDSDLPKNRKRVMKMSLKDSPGMDGYVVKDGVLLFPVELMDAIAVITPSNYDRALAEISKLLEQDPEKDSFEGKTLKYLANLIQKYEEQAFPFNKPTPEQAAEFRAEQMEVKPPDARKTATEVVMETKLTTSIPVTPPEVLSVPPGLETAKTILPEAPEPEIVPEDAELPGELTYGSGKKKTDDAAKRDPFRKLNKPKKRKPISPLFEMCPKHKGSYKITCGCK